MNRLLMQMNLFGNIKKYYSFLAPNMINNTMKLMPTFLIVLGLILGFESFGQQTKVLSLQWNESIEYGLEGKLNSKALNFEEANYDFAINANPFLYLEIENKGRRVLAIDLENPTYELLGAEEIALLDLSNIGEDVQLDLINGIVKKENKVYLNLSPFKKNSDQEVYKLIGGTLKWSYSQNRQLRPKSLNFASNSKLANGNWFKFATTKNAVFKLDYQFLKQLGLDIDNINPQNIQLFGYGGGTLPESNEEERYDDLVENNILVVGENDGSFDKRDYILFYGQGQITWSFDTANAMFRHNLNNYSDSVFYFITADGSTGKRISKSSNPAVVANDINTFDDYQVHELDQLNLIKSGQLWFGEVFEGQLVYDYRFEFPNIDLSSQGKVELSAAARAGVVSQMNVVLDNQSFTQSYGSTVLTNYVTGFARTSRNYYDFSPNDNLVDIKLTYAKPQAVAKAWLNYISLNVRRNLTMSGQQVFFRDINSINSGLYSRYNIASNSNIKVWDISDIENIQEKTLELTGNTRSFIADNSKLREFVAFNSPDSINIFGKGRVANQDLHGLAQTDMVIVSHPNFLSQANELASFHRQEGLGVHVVTPNQIYNEFSSGSQDPVAIRTFMKMFYDRAGLNDLPKYLLIIGDGSYDFKDRINGNTNYVISYQSRNSLQPVSSYVSDDYFALLDDSEGEWKFSNTDPEKMDVGVGRLPVQTAEEAQGVVNKIKAYSQGNTLADWRNKVTFVGDDQDGVTHMSQSNQLAAILENNNKDHDISKIFLDAYAQVSTSTGPRYPQAYDDIKRTVQEGTLIMNYTGHGGETGWAGERVLDIATITSWTNIQRQALFVTATCEFSRFDDPLRTSAGELVLLNEKGGGIGLLTTTRLVYSSPNYYLNQSFYNRVFDRDADGEVLRLGDIMLEVKNANATQGNTRNFSLLGDPAVQIAAPKYNVVTTMINGVPIAQVDTLKALSKATISGRIEDLNGNLLNDFNGFLYPTVYDKLEDKKSLNNDGGGVFNFQLRDSKIFKGKASVNNGTFQFEFIVPKDISYSFGKGKITYYTENGIEDGNGFTDQFIIGGSDPSFAGDDQGPEMEIFMNDETFIYGGITDENPYLVANLFDEQGINTVGNGIGHDLVAVIDDNTEQAIILNDYYESATDDYKKGTVSYPLSGLSEGTHTLSIKAWDNANNSSEKRIEFNVVMAKDIQINNLVNYPNPFTTRTEFIFQHNQPGIPMDVKLQVFTVSGKLVKSINQVIVNDGFLSRDLVWNGRDDFGDRIGKGVYVYKLQVRSRNGSLTEKIEKLVIL